MKKTTHKHNLVDVLTLPDLCRFCQVDEAWIVELVEHGVLEPKGTLTAHWHFHGAGIVKAKKASRLRRDLGINAAGVAMVLELLEERDTVLRKLAQYQTA